MKKLLSLLLIFITLFLTSCRFHNQNEAFYDIRIGVILPLSGENKAYGKAALDAVEMAVREVNRKGGVNFRKIQLIIQNSAGNPEKAAALADEMIEKDNIVAFLGAYSSEEALQLKLTAEKHGVPYISPLSSCEKLTEHASYTFQAAMSDEFQGAALASYLIFNRRAQKIAVLFNTAHGAMQQRALALRTAQALADFSSVEPLRLMYNSNDKSFAKPIKKCISEDINFIVLPEYAADALRFIVEARSLGYRGAFAGCDGYNDQILTGTAENLGVCFFTSPYYENNKSEKNQKFRELMQKYHKRTPTFAEALSYDAVQLLLLALENAYTPNEIAGNLKNMRSFQSVCGYLSYHVQRETLLRPAYIMGTSGGKTAPAHLSTVDAERLKNYRNREED